jgi:uncharacterized lipoprotein YddW (UPF0748 family)
MAKAFRSWPVVPAAFPFFLVLLFLSAYASAPTGPAAAADPVARSSKPVRGVWLHPGYFGAEKGAALEKIRATLEAYEKAGINTLIVLVKNTSGHLYYASDIGVRDGAWEWDFFEAFLAEARRRKMDVHPWFCVFPETSLLGQVREHPEWLIVGPGREMVRSVNPALPAVRAYEIGLMTEFVRKYDVDWVHLDYIRFPCEPDEPYFSHDAETLKLFQRDTGVDFAALMAKDSGNPSWNAWLEWNRDQVTRFLLELREALKATGRKVRISAAVFPDAANAAVLIGQDWAAWAVQGLVDMTCPMLYTNDTGMFERLLKRAVSYGRGRSLVCAGIGIGTSHNRNTPEGMLEQMAAAREAGADGVIFFSGSSLTQPFLDRLASARR